MNEMNETKKIKKTKKKLVIVSHFAHYIIDDCWKLVKEFAGIYNITADWSELGEMNPYVIYNHIREVQDPTYYTEGDGKSSAIGPIPSWTDIIHIPNSDKYKTMFERTKIILRLLWKHKNYDLLNNLYRSFAKAMNIIQKGDEIFYNGVLGVCVKKNKVTVQFAPYKIKKEMLVHSTLLSRSIECHYDKNKLSKSISIKEFRLPYSYELLFHMKYVDPSSYSPLY